MSFADDAEFTAFAHREHLLPHVTTEALATALDGFELPLLPDREINWLAMAVRRALAIATRHHSEGPDRDANLDIRRRLKRLSKLTRSTAEKLSNCDASVDDRLWTIAWRRWDGEDGNVSEPLEYRRYKAAVAEMDWLSDFLQLAAQETPSPQGPWRDKERRWIRVQRGQFLAPIFEAAFGQPVSANNYPSDPRHPAPTAFMDFYRRVVTLAYDAHETSNLTEVVKAACQQHRRNPAQFDEAVIPGL